MSDIEDLHRRITTAMTRISTGAAALAEKANVPAGPDPALETALEEERTANAQLEERLRALKAKHADDLAALRAELDMSSDLDRLRAEIDTQRKAMAKLDMDVQRLRQSNDQLRSSNAALREANEAGVGEPHLINKAMLAELEGLRAARATDAAEAGAILSQLEPLLAAARTPGEA